MQGQQNPVKCNTNIMYNILFTNNIKYSEQIQYI